NEISELIKIIFIKSENRREVWNGPVIELRFLEVEAAYGSKNVGVGGLIPEELVDEGGELRVLSAWERAVVVTANLGDTHVVCNAESLVDLASNSGASVRREVSEPLHVGVFRDVETSWGDQTSKHMVVEWEAVDLVNVLLKLLGEPDILSDDLLSGLDVLSLRLLVVRKSPAGRTS